MSAPPPQSNIKPQAPAVARASPASPASPVVLKRPPSARNKQPLPQLTSPTTTPSTSSSSAVVVATSALSSLSKSPSSTAIVSPLPSTNDDLSCLTHLLQQWMARSDARFSHIDTTLNTLTQRFEKFESTLADIQAQINSRSTSVSSASASSSTAPSLVSSLLPSAASASKAKSIELGFDPTIAPPHVECKYDVFLSHRRADSQDIMRAFKSALEPAGYNVYLDRDALVSTEDLMTSVAASATFLFFMSQHIFDSEWCLKELIQAVRYKRNIVLVSVAGCWWLDSKQQLCEFPIHLFPSYVVQQGGTSGIAVSFHRDFYDVVMTKIKQRLGPPLQKSSSTSLQDKVPVLSAPSAADAAEQEKLYESRLKEAANESRKLVTEVMECINTLLRVSATEKEVIDAIGWLGESGVMKGAAASAVRQQGFDAALSALNRLISSSVVVKAASNMFKKLLNPSNLTFFTSKPMFTPFLGILNSSTVTMEFVKTTVDLFASLIDPALEISLRTALRDFFTNNLQLEKSMIVAQKRFSELSGDVLEWCNNQFSIGAADKPSAEKKLILSVVLGIMNSSQVYDYCTDLILQLIQQEEGCRAHFVDLGGINAMMKVLEDDNCIYRCWTPAVHIISFFSGQAQFKPKLQALSPTQTLQEVLMTCKADTRVSLEIIVDLHQIFNDLGITLEDDTSEADIAEQVKVLLDVASTEEQLLKSLAWLRSSKDMALFAKEEIRKGGVDAIIATMKKYPSAILVIRSCTAALMQLNERPSNQPLIETEATYSSLTSILKTSSDPLMLSHCIKALAYMIAAGPHKELQRALFVKLNVVEIVVSAYQRCRSATETFLRFCNYHFSRDSDCPEGQRILELKDELLKYHLVRTILEALEKAFDVNPLSSFEQEFGWRVLDKVIKFMRADFQTEFCAARGLEICAKILVCQDVDSDRVVPALGVLLSLSTVPEMKAKMNALQFPAMLSKAIAAHPDSAEFITLIETITQNLA